MSGRASSRLRKILGISVLILALVFLLAGMRRSVKAYEPGTDEFGILAYQQVPERVLVEDATFGGITRKNGRVYSTYDRSAPKQGKRACPT